MHFKGKVFVSGGGDAQQSYFLDREFVRVLPRRLILYLPVGLVRTIAGYEGCYEWITSTLGKHSQEPLDITMPIRLSPDVASRLSSYDAVYIGGGKNTYRLLHLLYNAELIPPLVNYVAQGGAIYGGSAGAILLGHTIATVREENDGSYTHEQGLDLVGNFSILCHYDGTQDENVWAYIRHYRNPVLALPETSGVVVVQDHASVVGSSPAYVFDLNHCKIAILSSEQFSLVPFDAS